MWGVLEFEWPGRKKREKYTGWFSKGRGVPPLVLLCSACLRNLQSEKHRGWNINVISLGLNLIKGLSTMKDSQNYEYFTLFLIKNVQGSIKIKTKTKERTICNCNIRIGSCHYINIDIECCFFALTVGFLFLLKLELNSVQSVFRFFFSFVKKKIHQRSKKNCHQGKKKHT